MTADLATATDGELASLARAGRAGACGEIIRRHQALLLRLIRSHIGGDEEAVDVLQDCFVAAFLNLHRHDGRRPLRAWLARIAINKARDWHRRRRVRRLFFMAAPLTAEIADTAADDALRVDIVLDDRAALARTLAAIASLPASLKEPLILSTLDNWPQAAIGDLLGISEKAVETRIRRARARLRDVLAMSDANASRATAPDRG